MLLFETAIGTCGVDWSDAGITRVLLPRDRDAHGSRDADAAQAPTAVRAAVAGIVSLLGGQPDDLRDVALDLRGCGEFDRRVYDAARAVGPGVIASYGELTRAIGEPLDRARAVGAALGRNPCPIVVPCHRILAADGSLHGFSAPGGLATKRRMLEIERAPGFMQEALFA